MDIEEKRDNQEEILPNDNDIDLAGWELKKALRLFRKSNPLMVEWLHSPIVYAEPYDTAGKLRTLMQEYFSQILPASLPEHGNRNFETHLKKDLLRTKKYFYVLSLLLACDWIMQHNRMTPIVVHTAAKKV